MIRSAACMLFVIAAAGCAVLPKSAREAGPGYRGTGVASWYGEPFHGRPTASGAIYDMYGKTAAHRLLPLGTRLRVTNLDNGRVVDVTVNDRGPFVRGRVLDLSYGAARALAMIEQGTARVKFVVVDMPRGSGGAYTVQVGSFSVKRNAVELSERLAGDYSGVTVQAVKSGRDSLYRVRVGRFDREQNASKVARKIKRREGLEAFVTRLE